MEELNLEKFNPTKAEITVIVDKYKALEINGIEDKDGYHAVDEARKELKKVRVNIQKTGKEMREQAVAYQKAVITKEKELVELVEPTEKLLEQRQNLIDEEKEKATRKAVLPERVDRLDAINVIADVDFLLKLDSIEFESYFNDKNAEFLKAKEATMLAELAKIQEEKRKLEDERLNQERIAEAQRFAEQKKLEDDRLAEERRIAEEQRIAQQAVLDEQREKQHQIELEQVRKDFEAKAIKDLELKKLADKEVVAKEQEKLEKRKKYMKFLNDHGYTAETADNFHVVNKSGVVLLYTKVGEFKI